MAYGNPFALVMSRKARAEVNPPRTLRQHVKREAKRYVAALVVVIILAAVIVAGIAVMTTMLWALNGYTRWLEG